MRRYIRAFKLLSTYIRPFKWYFGGILLLNCLFGGLRAYPEITDEQEKVYARQ